jgi:hypothetical protein
MWIRGVWWKWGDSLSRPKPKEKGKAPPSVIKRVKILIISK